jgi:hypothetical protein
MVGKPEIMSGRTSNFRLARYSTGALNAFVTAHDLSFSEEPVTKAPISHS